MFGQHPRLNGMGDWTQMLTYLPKRRQAIVLTRTYSGNCLQASVYCSIRPLASRQSGEELTTTFRIPKRPPELFRNIQASSRALDALIMAPNRHHRVKQFSVQATSGRVKTINWNTIATFRCQGSIDLTIKWRRCLPVAWMRMMGARLCWLPRAHGPWSRGRPGRQRPRVLRVPR